MITNVSENCIENVCNISYLSEIVGGKKDLIREIMDTFLIQVSEDLPSINDAISKTDYVTINQITHSMKSSASIMGISAIRPVLEEMEALGASATNIDRIKELNQMLDLIYRQAIAEIGIEKLNYV
ncbi:MAG: Hpt domain-containing protein [Lentimicrobiaceae bacterium]|jgi:HPt (histidine-containing phosphotransfer) domain-containing protein